MAVEDNTFPTPSPNEVFVDRYRRITPKWYPWMKKLFEALRTTINAVGVVEQTVDNVRGLYGVSVNQNGIITASIKLDGSPADSSFKVLADNVLFYHQTSTGTFVVPFQSTITSGQPTITMNANVRINGDALIDGTLSANAFEANTILTTRIRSPDGRLDINPSATTPYIRLTS